MANIKSITTTGAVTGTGTLSLHGLIFGGFDLNGDGTNTATLVVRDGSVTGDILVDTSTIQGKSIYLPMKTSGSIYYAVGGTGGDAMLYSWALEVS